MSEAEDIYEEVIYREISDFSKLNLMAEGDIHA